jgi:hypothetical protein
MYVLIFTKNILGYILGDFLQTQLVTLGRANPTIASYDATGILVHFWSKNIFFYHEKRTSLLQRCSCKLWSRRIGSCLKSFSWKSQKTVFTPPSNFRNPDPESSGSIWATRGGWRIWSPSGSSLQEERTTHSGPDCTGSGRNPGTSVMMKMFSPKMLDKNGVCD